MRITLINHATVLIEVDGLNILTDPVYSRTIGLIIPRLRKPGIPFHELPNIDVILISHSHHDHLNVRTLRKLRRRHQSIVILPRGLDGYAHRCGFTRVVELAHWESCSHAQVRITCVPAKHKGRRTLWENPTDSQYCGYVIEGNSIAYFAGDTGYGDHFREIGTRFAINVALLPIGAYKPYTWFKDIHLNPLTALPAFLDLRAKHLVPIHWGTFKISDEPMYEPPMLLQKEARRLGLDDRVHILANGESYSPGTQ